MAAVRLPRCERIHTTLAERTGVQVVHSGAVMSKPEEIASMVAGAVDPFGSVDVLVNNAGIQFASPVDEFPNPKWELHAGQHRL